MPLNSALQYGAGVAGWGTPVLDALENAYTYHPALTILKHTGESFPVAQFLRPCPVVTYLGW